MESMKGEETGKKEGERGKENVKRRKERIDGRGRNKEILLTSPSNYFLPPWNSQVHYIHVLDLV